MIKKFALTLFPLVKNAKFGTIKITSLSVPLTVQRKYLYSYPAILQLKNKIMKDRKNLNKTIKKSRISKKLKNKKNLTLKIKTSKN